MQVGLHRLFVENCEQISLKHFIESHTAHIVVI